ncbi:MAG: NAD(P)-dependent oxidoreductase [Acidobacteriaceae bacterium]
MSQTLQVNPEVAERFQDLHPPLDAQAAVIEANRCLYCFDAPCTVACPTHIDVPRFIKKISSENLQGSAQTILDANILGASCSRVCPVQILCEGACVMHRYNKQPIQIGLLQRHAMDAFYANGGVLAKKTTETRIGKIACIGAGPASLACAAELRQRGFSVTIFDRHPLPGGLNTYGVAEYKLPATESLREIELVRSLGVEFQFDTEIVGEDSFTELEKQYDAIFLGVGLGAMHRLMISGDDHPSVVDALSLIAGYKTAGKLKVGRRVVVVGAGNTAIDAAIAAKRLGAEEVCILYRRSEPHISAFDFEYDHAKQEGVRFLWLTQPIAIHAKNSHEVQSIECLRMELAPDATPQPAFGSNFYLECDMVIPAIGQSPLLDLLAQCRGVTFEKGRVAVDRATGQTSNPKYFAGGDCVNGGREVVDAVADGKRAGIAIAQVLEAVHA